MSEAVAGILGAVGIFAYTFVWCWFEERSRRISKRKYDKQMAKYDTWKKHIDSM